ncbi:hypothetical protein QRQ56_25425 [Bradyrhizobium sp. U531]|uniref:hypothetical protein n=1 Tax=Bradyrhizobium sp. U531 TaxID=3053458 RepID=UPI003F426425
MSSEYRRNTDAQQGDQSAGPEPYRTQLIFVDDGLKETDWLRQILPADLISTVTTLGNEDCRDHRLYVFSSNKRRIADLAASLSIPAPVRYSVGLCHLSDEWFETDTSYYQKFDYVIRTHHARRFERGGIFTIPLGFPNGTGQPPSITPITVRTTPWSFVGTPVTTRHQMARAMDTVQGGKCIFYDPAKGEAPPLSKADFSELMSDTVFCPAPMGNVMLESWRCYEALEAGAIPLLEKRYFLDYFENLLGPNPIPTFYHWSEASDFVKLMLARPEQLAELQKEVFEWWLKKRISIKAQLGDFLRKQMGTCEGVRSMIGNANNAVPFARTSQYLELAKHHNAYALTYRLRRIADRALRGHALVRHGVR